MKLFVNAVSAKSGGALTYLAPFLKHAAESQPDWEFVVFLAPKTAASVFPKCANVRPCLTQIGYAPWWRRLWWEQLTLRRAVWKERPDALYSMANFGMIECPVPQVLLVRNALYFSADFQSRFLTQYAFSDLTSFRLRRWLIEQSVRSADVVMTPTEAALQDLRHYVHIPAGKVLVNPYGQDVDELAGSPAATSVPTSPIVRLLYVSYYREHKNLTTLLKALRELRSSLRRAYKLITTLNPEVGEALETLTSSEDRGLLNDPDVGPAVEIAGPCSPSAALELYDRCDLFIFPSIIESFGFPMVEAMAHGLPLSPQILPSTVRYAGRRQFISHCLISRDWRPRSSAWPKIQACGKPSGRRASRACGHVFVGMTTCAEFSMPFPSSLPAAAPESHFPSERPSPQPAVVLDRSLRLVSSGRFSRGDA